MSRKTVTDPHVVGLRRDGLVGFFGDELAHLPLRLLRRWPGRRVAGAHEQLVCERALVPDDLVVQQDGHVLAHSLPAAGVARAPARPLPIGVLAVPLREHVPEVLHALAQPLGCPNQIKRAHVGIIILDD